jgi:drug/metabolite transporter (DMT)-like permease
VAVVAVSTSAPLIAATAVPGLAVAFWRNALAAGALGPAAGWRSRRELSSLTARERALAVGAGVLLGGHFAAWVPSVRLTTVAASTALVTVQPVWAALLARLRGDRLGGLAWAGIVVATAGAVLVTGAGVAVSGRALQGDGLALAGGLLAAAYVTVGAEVRRTVSTTGYTTVAYASAASVLAVACAAAGVPFSGYRAADWARIAALTLGAQFLGHSLFNRVLRTTSATVVSMAVLFEAPGAALIAFLWLHQRPAPLTVIGLVVLLAGVGLVVAAGAPRAPRPGRADDRPFTRTP